MQFSISLRRAITWCSVLRTEDTDSYNVYEATNVFFNFFQSIHPTNARLVLENEQH